MGRTLSFLALAVACLGWPVLEAEAQSAIEADGVIESKSGGFRFPDGSVQMTAASPGTAPVEDTGQAGCWDKYGSPIGCSGTGQDGELQRGVDWPAPRFEDNLDGTVTDKLTGLIWLKQANCASLFAPTIFDDALDAANGLSQGFCGLIDGSEAGDWRLPNVKELTSLIDYGRWSPALPGGHPFIGVQSQWYWSSSSYVSGPAAAWRVSFTVGLVSVDDKTSHEYVWPVRGGQ